MAATYPATNLQLQYNSANDEWSFTEVAYDYPTGQVPSWQGYTTPDIPFPTDENGNGDENGDEDRDPCPPGYIYDEVLKQCVPDPNYTAPAYAGEPGTDREEPNPLSYRELEGYPDTMAKFSREDMFRWGLDKGYLDKFGNIIGPMQTTAPGWLGTIGQSGNVHQFNQWIQHAKDKGIFKEMAGKPDEVSGMISFGGPPQPIMDSWLRYIPTVDLTTTGLQEVKKYVPTEGTQFPAGGEFSTPLTYTPTTGTEYPTEGEFANVPITRDDQIKDEKIKQEEQKTLQEEIKTNKDKQEMQSTVAQAEKSRAQDVATGKFSGSPSAKTDKPKERKFSRETGYQQ